jgi:hypothetical protein
MSLCVAFREFRSGWAKNILWAFAVFYGFTFVISIDNSGSDVNRYVSWFKAMADQKLSFSDFTKTLYSVEAESADVLQPSVSYLVSRFTSNHAFLLATFGLIFGYFYSRNIWMVLERLTGNLKPLTVFLLVVFAVTVPLWNLNGFRFWTATHVFFFGTFTFLMTKSKKAIIIAALSTLVHFSFLLPSAILIIYLVIGNRFIILFWIFIASFLANELDVSAFRQYAENYLPDVFVEKADPYTTAESIQEFRTASNADKNWYAILYKKLLRWTSAAFLVGLFFRRSIIRQYGPWLRLFSFSLLIYSASNMASLVPSGVRFLTIANLFVIPCLIFYIQNGPYDRTLKRLVLISIVPLSLFLLVTIREGFNSFGLFTVLGNPAVAMTLGGGGDIALIDIIKWR